MGKSIMENSEIPTFEDWFGDNEHRLTYKNKSEKEVARAAWNYAWRKAAELLEEIP